MIECFLPFYLVGTLAFRGKAPCFKVQGQVEQFSKMGQPKADKLYRCIFVKYGSFKASIVVFWF